MKKKILKNIVSLMALLLMVAPMFLLANSASAALQTEDLWGGTTGQPGYDAKAGSANIQTAAGLGKADPRVIVANVIRAVLGFLGIVAVVIIVIGGFEWMTSGGSDEKAKKGRTRITNGVIGLLIILAAYGIANFAIGALSTVTTS